jgi:hypothetical protein
VKVARPPDEVTRPLYPELGVGRLDLTASDLPFGRHVAAGKVGKVALHERQKVAEVAEGILFTVISHLGRAEMSWSPPCPSK